MALPQHGSISMSPTGEVLAGSKVTLTFVYTVGSAGMKQGGSLRIATPNDGWQEPLVPLHRYFQAGHERGGYDDGYCSYARRNVAVELRSDTGAWIDLAAEERCPIGNLKGPWARHIAATVRSADLAEGDRITITYGDTTWGEDGVEVQRVAPTDKDHFHAYVDLTGEREFVELPADELRKLRVMPGPASRFNIVAPAIVRPWEAFTVKIAATDEFKNRPSNVFAGGPANRPSLIGTGDLRVSTELPGMAVNGTVSFTKADANRKELAEVKALAEGVHRISVEPGVGGRRSTSNPIWCTTRPHNVYFGDLHCQSQYHSDSIGTPDEGYEYGRDVACLDFMGITDSGGCYKDGWIETQEATQRHYAPGTFVTLKGHEYGASVGHRNVIYRDCEMEPVLDDLPRNDPTALFGYYRDKDVIIIPHHTKVWTEWQHHDPELEPIVEAYSCWGSGVEKDDPLWSKSIKPGAGAFAALARGYRLGFIGSGDSHAGLPGRSYPADRQWCVDAKSGFACVYAPELTREAIFDALKRRHCYATTGVRMVLEFSVNDAAMGSEAVVPDRDTPRVIRVHAIGERDLRVMRIVKNNDTLVRRELNGDEAFFEYHDTTQACSGDFYYVRVEQEDGNTGWSSPVWVNLDEH